MSAASELRKALKDLKYPLSQGGVIVRQWQSDEVVDAILDAVIEALPDIYLTENTDFDEGEKTMLEKSIDLLQSAKTQKGEK